MFRFKQFKIEQDRCAMKVGTDGVLLGAWATVNHGSKLLDIGTGTGLIALMCAQRNSDMTIVGIEIDPEASQQAKENVEESPFASRVEIVALSLQEFAKGEIENFDVIVCNPPYFIDSLKAPNMQRNLARHTDMLSFQELTQGVMLLLKKSGMFSVILPTTEALELKAIAESKGLKLQRICHVYPTQKRIERRTLMEFGFDTTPILEEELVIELQRHVYSEEYSALTKDFYLDK